MYGLLMLVLIGALLVFWHERPEDAARHPSRLMDQLDKLWDISQKSIKERKYLRAEKALLTILRFDEKNSRAYNRLGILYAKQRQFADAIECFEIAQSLQPSASSLHNVGLIYYETGDFGKAAQAFEQALRLEEKVASRHIAYAKVLEETGKMTDVITELGRAVELEPNPQSVGLLTDALERDGQTERAEKMRKIIEAMLKKGRRERIKQPDKTRI
jgi:tetratricopeptide (TPR) repeat protein